MSEVKALVAKGAADDERMRHALRLVANGASVRRACTKAGISRQTFLRRVERDPHWRDAFAFSTAARAHALADDLLAVADGEHSAKRLASEIADAVRDLPAAKVEGVTKALLNAAVNRDRLRFDARRWLSARLLPSTYGATAPAQSATSAPPVVRVVFEPLPTWPDESAQKSLPVESADYEIID